VLLLREVCTLQNEDSAVDGSESYFTFQLRCNVQPVLLSPVPDDDDGFAELNDFGSDLEVNDSVTKCHVTNKKTASCRKRRRGVTDSIENDSLSAVGHNSVDVITSPPCFVGHETPTSSKQAVKRAKECTDISHDVTRPAYSSAAGRRLVRCHSEAVIHQALSTSEEQSNLIGDFSRPHSLPLLSSAKHQDLRSISPDTVSCNQVILR